jgi:hypothetical protein
MNHRWPSDWERVIPRHHPSQAGRRISPANPAAFARSWLPGLLASLIAAAALGAEPAVEREGHPLDPVIEWAEAALQRAEQIKDYTALLVKRERVGDQLLDYQYIELKVRHEPFSVYLKFLKPDHLKDREILYVHGQNDEMLLAHDAGGLGELVGTVSLVPHGMIAMRGQRYPVTLIGFRNLAEKLIEQAKRDRQIDAACDVKWFHRARVDGRPARCVQVTHPVRHPEHQFAMARVYIDQQLGIPIRFEGYAWPDKADGAPVLVEEYTYCGVRANVGLTDKDFDPKNPQYRF